jgi:hypothetical protein
VDELRDACEVAWINDGYAQTLCPENANVLRAVVNYGDAANASQANASRTMRSLSKFKSMQCRL